MYHIYNYLRKLNKSCSKLKKKYRNEMQKTEHDRKERIFLLVKKQRIPILYVVDNWACVKACVE